jgi:DNA-binding MarR family transcriptional regulator
MKLTRRQEEFVRSLLDLYGEMHEPFHYSELAERLGVSRFTAYDMLRILEEKGIVASQYQLDEARSGPGRSAVMYEPTPRARRILADVFGEGGKADWQEVTAQLIELAQEGALGDEELAQELLARTPPDEPPTLRYCLEVMTVVALRLRRHADGAWLAAQAQALLAASEENCRAALSLLGGLALGALGDDEDGSEAWQEELQEHLWQYQALVVDMAPSTCRRLAQGLEELFAPLGNR